MAQGLLGSGIGCSARYADVYRRFTGDPVGRSGGVLADISHQRTNGYIASQIPEIHRGEPGGWKTYSITFNCKRFSMMAQISRSGFCAAKIRSPRTT